MHVRGRGSEKPKSPQEPCQVFDKQSTALEVCRSKAPEQTCSRRTLERISELVSLAHTRLGTSGDPRSGFLQSEGVKPGANIPDDVLPEEPHVEEAKVPEEIPNAVRLAITRIHKNMGHPSE